MFKVKYSFLVASLLTVPTLSYAFKLPVPALPQQESATATSGVPDAAAQESLVKRFVSAQTLSLAAQINFAKALGLADQVQLLEAEQLALSSGSTNSKDLKKNVEASANVQKVIDEKQAAKPELNSESKKIYAEGLVLLVSSSLEAKKLGTEATNFANGLKGVSPFEAARLTTKLSSGVYVATQAPNYLGALFNNTKQALEFAKSNKIKAPANVDALEF